MVRVLVAPQELKGSLTAEEAAAAIAAGIRQARPAWDLDLCPMSDGGPGFLDAVERAAGGQRRTAAVHDALGRQVAAEYLLVDDLPLAGRDACTAVVETAQANGLWRIAPSGRDALAASTVGVGELLAAALVDGPARIIAGVGGSATTDGGAGMAQALGARLAQRGGAALRPGGEALRDLDRIDWTRPSAWGAVELLVATDVTNPLLGPEGAAPVYGPQKGASARDVIALAAGLERLASVIERDLGVSVGHLSGAGAGGGLVAGMVSFLGARIISGFDVVAILLRLEKRLTRADLVVTAEGSYDAQSMSGKTTGRIQQLALARGKPCTIFAGTAAGSSAHVRTLVDLAGTPERAMSEAARWLAAAAAAWANAIP